MLPINSGCCFNKAIDAGLRRCPPDKIRHIDRVEIAGAEESVYSLQSNVVGVAKIWKFPVESSHGGIGSLPYRDRFGTDRVFAV